MKQLIKPQKKISIILCLFLTCILFVGCGGKTTKETSTSNEKVQVSENIENPTVGTQQITVTTSDGKTVTFDENEVETSVDSNGNTTYKLDDNTTVVVSSTEGTATVTTKNEDGTTSSTVSNNVTITPVINTPTQSNKPVDVIINTPVETQTPTMAPTSAPVQPPTQPVIQQPFETQAPTEAPTNPPETQPYIPPTPTEAPTPAPTQAPWTLDVDSYMAQMDANLRDAGKVTIREYYENQYGVGSTDGYTNDFGAGYVEIYTHSQSTANWSLSVLKNDVPNAYYLQYMGKDGNDYVFRVYRI
ncbi:hypothetical protein [[Clostridium] fimetarium]|uniref:Uncharacterized protein n=1 Tax=[Clostridium] fimetarium TaxID=99656 RepID=A0A1I0QWR2_9FIRM|nr:hypothetical protein [[Clostridium] fimetarium]SEW31747.1 hypothetical protein SAMN05421659_109178 [[Clostridium] fimetarium]